MLVDVTCLVVVVAVAYVVTVVRSVGRHAHSTLEAVEKRVVPEPVAGPVQLRPSRWGRANR